MKGSLESDALRYWGHSTPIYCPPPLHGSLGHPPCRSQPPLTWILGQPYLQKSPPPPPTSPHKNTEAILYLQKSPSPSPHMDIGAILPTEVPLPSPHMDTGPSYLQKSPSPSPHMDIGAILPSEVPLPLPSRGYWDHPNYSSTASTLLLHGFLGLLISKMYPCPLTWIIIITFTL